MEAIERLHARLIVTGSFSRSSSSISRVLLSYALSVSPPRLASALRVFRQIEDPTTFIWNTVIRGLVHAGAHADAVSFYHQMREAGVRQDNMTFPFALKACARLHATRRGMGVHSHCFKLGFASDVFVANSLIHLYAVFGYLARARMVFDEMPVRDVVSWNSLICGYGQRNCLREALSLFNMMRAEGLKADEVTMVKVVSACIHLGEWDLAERMVKYVEENGVKVDVYMGNTLIDYYGRRGMAKSAEKIYRDLKEKNIVTFNAMITTYAKASDLVAARKIFDTMPVRDLISWSSIITGYSQANYFSDALEVFRMMQKAKVKPDEIVIVSVISACAHLGAINLGKWIHEYIRKNNIRKDTYLQNALMDMYSKCGCIMEAIEVFKEMLEKDTMSWNIIILGLATNSYTNRALEEFSRMLKDGFQPNEVTFLGILIACAHGELVDLGLKYIESMKEGHGVEPQMKHYGCVVDLLSRSGKLEKAYKFIMEMPIEPDPIIWRTLLGACQLHGNVHLAEVVTKELLRVDPNDSGNYILLSNAYAQADRWGDATSIRKRMADIDVIKIPGCSSIQVNGTA